MKFIEISGLGNEDYHMLWLLLRVVLFDCEIAVARSRRNGWFLHLGHRWQVTGWYRNFYLRRG